MFGGDPGPAYTVNGGMQMGMAQPGMMPGQPPRMPGMMPGAMPGMVPNTSMMGMHGAMPVTMSAGMPMTMSAGMPVAYPGIPGGQPGQVHRAVPGQRPGQDGPPGRRAGKVTAAAVG